MEWEHIFLGAVKKDFLDLANSSGYVENSFLIICVDIFANEFLPFESLCC
jgi:hypothetical protein